MDSPLEYGTQQIRIADLLAERSPWSSISQGLQAMQNANLHALGPLAERAKVFKCLGEFPDGSLANPLEQRMWADWDCPAVQLQSGSLTLRAVH